MGRQPTTESERVYSVERRYAVNLLKKMLLTGYHKIKVQSTSHTRPPPLPLLYACNALFFTLSLYFFCYNLELMQAFHIMDLPVTNSLSVFDYAHVAHASAVNSATQR